MTDFRPERRHIVKAGVWTLPVVAVATAAPAFATSGANLSTSTATTRITNFFSFDQRVETTVALRNTGSGPTASLTVTITITITGDLRALSYPQASAPAGWTLTTVDTASDTATYTRNAPLAAGSTENVVFLLRRAPSFDGEDVTIVITPGNGGSGRTLNVSA